MRLIGIVLLLLAGLAAARAQPQQPPPHQAAALSPREAQGALAVLNDPKRRAQLIATLEAIAKAAPDVTPATPVPAPAAAPVAPAAPAKTATIAPDSVGVQLIGRLSVMVSAYGQQIAMSARSVNNLPILWDWLASQAVNPVARANVLEAFGKLLLVLAGALLVEFVVRWLLRRLRGALIALAPHRSDAAAPIPASPAVERQRRRFDGLITALKQVPALIGRLLLDLLPVGAFMIAAGFLMQSRLGTPLDARLVSQQAVQAYAAARVILAIGAFLFSPARPRLRLLGVSDWAAEFLSRWTRRTVTIIVASVALGNIGLIFGMDPTSRGILLKLCGLVLHAWLVIAVLQARRPVAARLRLSRAGATRWAAAWNAIADRWHRLAILLVVGSWLVWAVQPQNGYERLLDFCVVTGAVVIGARLIAVLLLGGMERVRTRVAPDGTGRIGFYFPVLRLMISVMIWFCCGIALLEAWDVPVLLWVTAGGLGGRVMDAALTIVITILLAVAVWEAVNVALARQLANLSGTAQLARVGRLRTLLPLLRTSLLVTLVLIVGMIVLSAVGVNIAPLLAGAGVVGIAIGFGSQKLVQDLITGLFLLLENAMQVGDVVTVATMTGTVEALSIRTIRLRALDGAVHIIPFSSVTTVTNQTRDYGYAVLDVSIGLNEEPGPVEKILRDVATEMQADPAWQSMILADLDVMGVDKLTDLAWIMRMRIKTQPGSRWSVGRELNRRIKERFDELAIESPFTSHRVLSRDPPTVGAPAAEQAA